MSIARILVPVRGDGTGENVLAHAAAIARRHNAHVAAVHCRARPRDMIPVGVAIPNSLRALMERQAQEFAADDEASLRKLFGDLMGRLGIEVIESGVPPRDRPTASFSEEEGRQMDVVKRHGRLADLVAIAKPDRGTGLGFRTLEAALFSTGRPVLVCPPAEKPPEALGVNIAIAWNGSAEVARAVALAMPLIQRAESVAVLDGGADEEGAPGEDFITYLDLRGIAARHAPIKGGGTPGRVILDTAATLGADLVVMGAYSRSRGYEAVFGGVTQYVIDHCAIPVVMVH